MDLENRDLGTPPPSGEPSPPAPGTASAEPGAQATVTPPAENWKARYEERERTISRQGEENKRLRAELEARRQERPQGQDFDTMTEEEFTAYVNKVGYKQAHLDMIAASQARLEATVTQHSMQSVVSAFERDTKSFPGFADLKPKIREYLERPENRDLNNPDIVPSHLALKAAYDAVKDEYIRTDERRKMQEEMDRKAGTFSEGSTGTGGTTKGKSREEITRDLILNAGKSTSKNVFGI